MAQFIIAIETDEPYTQSAKRLIRNLEQSKHVKDFRLLPCIFNSVDDLEKIVRGIRHDTT